MTKLTIDKRVLRFFRQRFGREYKNLRSVYLALCEIEDDFGGKPIHGFTKTVSAYTGMIEDTIRPYLKALKKSGFVEVRNTRKTGVGSGNEKLGSGGIVVRICNWKEVEEDRAEEIIQISLSIDRKSGSADPGGKHRFSGSYKSLTSSSNKITNPNKRGNTPKGAQARAREEDKIHPSQFDTFWASYPRKVGALAAKKAWEKACKMKNRPTLQEVLDAIKLQSQTEQWQDKRFIPHPSTWLNQGRWMDEVVLPAKKAKKKPGSSGTGWAGNLPKVDSKEVREKTR